MATKTKAKKAAKGKAAKATKHAADAKLVQAPSGVNARPGSIRSLIVERCSDKPVVVTELLDAAAELGKSKVTVYRQLREAGFEIEHGTRLVVRAK